MIDRTQLDKSPNRRALAIGMWLFLASLSMLFISSMLGYILCYLGVFGKVLPNRMHLPALTWLSTAVLLAASFTMHRAVVAVRRERLALLRSWLYAASALSVVFLMVQTPCMVELFRAHLADLKTIPNYDTGTVHPLTLDGVIFFLIILHAVHVIGGLVAMAVVMFNVFRDKYDHESYMGIQHAALYWHFLDAVWLVMFTVFMVTG